MRRLLLWECNCSSDSTEEMAWGINEGQGLDSITQVLGNDRVLRSKSLDLSPQPLRMLVDGDPPYFFQLQKEKKQKHELILIQGMYFLNHIFRERARSISTRLSLK